MTYKLAKIRKMYVYVNGARGESVDQTFRQIERAWQQQLTEAAVQPIGELIGVRPETRIVINGRMAGSGVPVLAVGQLVRIDRMGYVIDAAVPWGVAAALHPQRVAVEYV